MTILNKKIITIGFHRTATTTLRKIFTHNNLHSVVGGGDTEARLRAISLCDTISDWGENHITFDELLLIKKQYPNAIYLLNTRSLKHWISSRFRMYIHRLENDQLWSLQKTELFDPTSISLKTAQAFIKQREFFYKICSDIFHPEKDHLIVVDIQGHDFIPFVCDKLSLNPLYPNYPKYNDDARFCIPKLLNIFRELESIYGEKLNTVLSMDTVVSKKLKMFPNNLKY